MHWETRVCWETHVWWALSCLHSSPLHPQLLHKSNKHRKLNHGLKNESFKSAQIIVCNIVFFLLSLYRNFNGTDILVIARKWKYSFCQWTPLDKISGECWKVGLDRCDLARQITVEETALNISLQFFTVAVHPFLVYLQFLMRSVVRSSTFSDPLHHCKLVLDSWCSLTISLINVLSTFNVFP